MSFLRETMSQRSTAGTTHKNDNEKFPRTWLGTPANKQVHGFAEPFPVHRTQRIVLAEGNVW